jgi:hypothetical protein
LTAFEALVDQIQKTNLEGGLKGIVADKALGIFERRTSHAQDDKTSVSQSCEFFYIAFHSEANDQPGIVAISPHVRQFSQ